MLGDHIIKRLLIIISGKEKLILYLNYMGLSKIILKASCKTFDDFNKTNDFF